MAARLERLDEIKRNKGIDAFLFTSSTTLKHLSGFFYNFEIGPSPFHLIPAALFVEHSQNSCIIVADSEDTSTINQRIPVKQYSSYVYEKPLEPSKSFLARLHEVFNEKKVDNARIGIESGSLPWAISQFLLSHYPGIQFIDVSSDMLLLRMVKDSDEIACIREATRLCDVGQAAAMKYAKPGITELEFFTLIRGEMDLAAGQRISMMADLVSGNRTYSAGGSPSKKLIQSGDLILSDLTPCLNGYWGDTCSTFVVGKAGSDEKRDDFQLIKEALDIGITAIRPGVRANEVDRLMREHIAKAGWFSHHGGHGVGVAYHEEPRITPYNTIELAPGMVIALEPGVYRNGYGVRLEHVVVVTETGCEIVSKFDHCFDQRSE